MKEIIYLLATLGGGVIAAIAIAVIGLLISKIKEKVRDKRFEHMQKHRFDKPPIAKCYCIDCECHNNENNHCYKFDGWNTADSWFCWDAEPRKRRRKGRNKWR